MGFIILGLIIASVIFLMSYIAKSTGKPIVFALIFLSIFSGLILGLCEATGGYSPKEEIKSVNLHGLSAQSSLEENPIYVIINGNSTCTFCREVKLPSENDNSISYATDNISYSDVTIVEDENCTTPQLVEYLQKPRITIWSFGLAKRIKSYTFYVPKDSVVFGIENS